MKNVVASSRCFFRKAVDCDEIYMGHSVIHDVCLFPLCQVLQSVPNLSLISVSVPGNGNVEPTCKVSIQSFINSLVILQPRLQALYVSIELIAIYGLPFELTQFSLLKAFRVDCSSFHLKHELLLQQLLDIVEQLNCLIELQVDLSWSRNTDIIGQLDECADIFLKTVHSRANTLEKLATDLVFDFRRLYCMKKLRELAFHRDCLLQPYEAQEYAEWQSIDFWSWPPELQMITMDDACWIFEAGNIWNNYKKAENVKLRSLLILNNQPFRFAFSTYLCDARPFENIQEFSVYLGFSSHTVVFIEHLPHLTHLTMSVELNSPPWKTVTKFRCDRYDAIFACADQIKTLQYLGIVMNKRGDPYFLQCQKKQHSYKFKAIEWKARQTTTVYKPVQYQWSRFSQMHHFL
jgi:hypothetical protein